jgi:DNA-binding beta-propeller fold protein YncE
MRSSITFALAFGRLRWWVAEVRRARWVLTAGLSLVAILGAGVLVPVQASANQAHYFAGSPAGSFGGPGQGSGQLELAAPQFPTTPQLPTTGGSGIAVNETTGEVYVADTENQRISVFDPSRPPGERFLFAFGADVGGSGIDTCTISCAPGTPGDEPGEFEAPTFLAVDQSGGDVYVGDASEIVQKFTAGGELISTWGEGGRLGTQPFVVASGSGDLTTGSTKLANLHAGSGQFGQFPISGEGIPAGTHLEPREGVLQLSQAATLTKTGVSLTQTTTFGGLAGLAVHGGDLFVFSAESDEILRFEADASFVGPFARAVGAGPAGLAFDGEGDSYLVDGHEHVQKLDPVGDPLGPVVGGVAIAGLSADLFTGALYADEGGTALGAYTPQCAKSHESGNNVFVCESFQAFGEGRLDEGAGLAVDSSTGTVYAVSAGDEEILAFPAAVEAVTEAATDRTASSATLNGKIDAFGSALIGCRFEYGVGSAEGESSVPCAGTPAANGQVAVEAPVSGLEGSTTYSFRLSATNANGHVEGDEGTFTTLESPGIESAEAKEVSAGSAVLTAKIDPRGSETHYHFEWGPCEGSCLTSPYPVAVPVPDGQILPGTPTTVEQVISGLQPGTTYHFRVFATNANGPVTGTEHTFVYLPSAPTQTGCGNEELRQSNGSTRLPDCRAYELVTPARKNGSLIGALFIGQLAPQIAEDGSHMTTPALQCLPGTPSCIGHRQSEGEPYEFFRGPDGWQVNPLAPPAAQFQTHSWLLFGAEPGSLLFSAPDSAGTDDLWTRGEGGAFRRLGPLGEPGTSFNVFSPRAALSTADLSHVVYETVQPVWPFDEGNRSGGVRTSSLYEYTPASGSEPQLVGVTGGFEGGDNHNLISVCGTGIANSNGYDTLSEDGRIVYFSPSACASGSGTNAGEKVPAGELYERIDQSRTIEVSAAVPTTCTNPECEASTSSEATFESSFEGGSRSGERALFTSTQQLTDGASQDGHASDQASSCARTSSAASGCNLYLSECPGHCEDPSRRRLIDVSEGAKAEGGPKVLGVVAISADAGRVFFVAKGALTTTENEQGEAAVPGAYNLYVYERDEAHPQGRLGFVAKLSIQDQPNWAEGHPYEGPGSVGTFQGLGRANISPDGRYLVFESHRALTPGATGGAAQIYRYDASEGVMTRVSIGQAGFGDDGNAGRPGADATIAAAKNAFAFADGPAHADPTMSNDGRFVFFQSPVALTPGALEEVVVEELPTNTFYAQNIYEWEEDGAGGCRQTSGCVSLLSDGEEEIGSGKIATQSPELLGTDATGKNVFIAAEDPLTWQDTDTQRDYYDLKVGGGFAPPAAVAQPCSGDGCRGAGTSAGPGTSPATSSADGPEEGPKHPRKAKPKTCKKKKGKKGSTCRKQHKKKQHGGHRRKHASKG